MTIQAGTRLAQISTSGSAAQRLRQAAGVAGTATAAALLVAWSGLASATAAEHLLHERVVAQPGGGGLFAAPAKRPVPTAGRISAAARGSARTDAETITGAAAPPAGAAQPAVAAEPAEASVAPVARPTTALQRPLADGPLGEADAPPGGSDAAASSVPQLSAAAQIAAPHDAVEIAGALDTASDHLALLLILAIDEACT